MSRALPALAALLVLLLAPAGAVAHELTVLAPGSHELDLGTVSSPRLVHGTLVTGSDSLTLTMRPGLAARVLLLVPDVAPERGSSARPTISMPRTEGGDELRLTDEATGLRYRVVSEGTMYPPRASQPVELTIARGEAPTRVAVLVGDPDAQFIATDPERTPRTLARLRAWAETPAAGSVPDRPTADRSERAWMAWSGAAIALVALLTAVWWVRAGRARSRIEGAERASRER